LRNVEKKMDSILIGLKHLLLSLTLVLFSLSGAMADVQIFHHDLKVSLFPPESRLAGVDEISIRTKGKSFVDFYLSQSAMVKRVEVNGRPKKIAFNRGRLRIPLGRNERNEEIKISLWYQSVFDDPVPVMPVNTDNPGYGVTGIISEQGSFLLSGAGWYPEIPESRPTFNLHVDAPAGVFAVTAGKLLGHETKGKRTLSSWSVIHPVDGLSLSAARYVVREKSVGKIKAMTYMLPESDYLSKSYLDATARYISQYEDLFGPYPFDKFAVVENFFPTGYGFPSYTLLGSRVLRLPFIIHTSLGHEIAHCWWGNGVYVNYAKGNWGEGLTTYVSDYLFKEMASDAAAREYRLQLLRNYLTLVKPGDDFPLNRFQSRKDPVTKTIGYDKSAMVFHMLRKKIGEKAFWGALQDVFKNRLFKPISWNDLQVAFEDRTKTSLEKFFAQWVQREGAIRISLEGVTATPKGDSWIVNGVVVQKRPFYHIKLNLELETNGYTVGKHLILSNEKTPFEITSKKRPKRFSVDPDFDIFRALYPSEIPPTVNSLKGSSSVRVVLAGKQTTEEQNAAKLLVNSLGLNNVQFISEMQVKEQDLRENDLLVIGYPGRRDLLRDLPEPVLIKRGGFNLNNTAYDQSSDIFFGVFKHPFTKNRIMAVFLPMSDQFENMVARKITHYGKYSYLAFQKGRNQDKGTWPIESSPLVVKW